MKPNTPEKVLATRQENGYYQIYFAKCDRTVELGVELDVNEEYPLEYVKQCLTAFFNWTDELYEKLQQACKERILPRLLFQSTQTKI